MSGGGRLVDLAQEVAGAMYDAWRIVWTEVSRELQNTNSTTTTLPVQDCSLTGPMKAMVVGKQLLEPLSPRR